MTVPPPLDSIFMCSAGCLVLGFFTGSKQLVQAVNRRNEYSIVPAELLVIPILTKPCATFLGELP